MSTFAFLSVCIQACLIQNVYSQLAGASLGASYDGADVAVDGELPVGGSTAVGGQVPIIGAVQYGGPVCAAGSVTIAGNCNCRCSPCGY